LSSRRRLPLDHFYVYASDFKLLNLHLSKFHHVEDDRQQVLILAIRQRHIPQELNQGNLDVRNEAGATVLILLLFLLVDLLELTIDLIELPL